VVDANQARQDILVDFSDGIFASSIHRENNRDRAVLGTLTLRYPIPVRALRHTFLAELRHLWRGPEASQRALCRAGEGSISSRQLVIPMPRRGQSARWRWHGNPVNSAHRWSVIQLEFSWTAQKIIVLVRTGVNFAF